MAEGAGNRTEKRRLRRELVKVNKCLKRVQKEQRSQALFSSAQCQDERQWAQNGVLEVPPNTNLPVSGWWLDLTIIRIFSKLNDFMILCSVGGWALAQVAQRGCESPPLRSAKATQTGQPTVGVLLWQGLGQVDPKVPANLSCSGMVWNVMGKGPYINHNIPRTKFLPRFENHLNRWRYSFLQWSDGLVSNKLMPGQLLTFIYCLDRKCFCLTEENQ